MFVEGTNGIRPIGDGLLEVTDTSLKNLVVQGDINEIYDVEQTPFARGKFATVRRAMHKKTGVKFAAKFLRRRRRAQCTLKEIRHEIAILLLCADSEHIVKLHSVHETSSEMALLLELATGGELQTLLDEAGSLTECQTRICMQEVLKALQYLHKKSIAHLDLKPQNILLCGDQVEDGLKLCDFGISRIVAEGGSKVREILGTPDYVAPEVLSYEPLSLKTDIWSVGVLAYVLLSGFSPFGGDTKQETFLNISQCNLTFPEEDFNNVSLDAMDFIKSALQVTADDRMTAHECLEHKWLVENSSKNVLKNGTLNSPDYYNLVQNVDSKTPAKPGVDLFMRKTQKVEHQSPSSSNPIQTQTTADINAISTNNATNEFCTKDECLKPIVTSNSSSSCSTLLKDYTNKENINLSKILVNRTPLSSLNKGKTLVNNCTLLEYPGDCSDVSTTIISNGNATAKYEKSLFPDAPTTPKVSRKSISDSATPTCVTLVKQFQLSHSHKTSTASDYSAISGDCNAIETYTTNKYKLNRNDELHTISTTSSSSLNIISKDTSYCTITGNSTISNKSSSNSSNIISNNHHHHLNIHHNNLSRSINSSTLSTNTVGTESSSTHCICDKTSSSCCCSTTTLYRDKSIAVVDNSILC